MEVFIHPHRLGLTREFLLKKSVEEIIVNALSFYVVMTFEFHDCLFLLSAEEDDECTEVIIEPPQDKNLINEKNGYIGVSTTNIQSIVDGFKKKYPDIDINEAIDIGAAIMNLYFRAKAIKLKLLICSKKDELKEGIIIGYE